MTVDELKLGIGVTVAGWAALLAYFPQDPQGKALIMRLVENLVVPRGTADQKAIFAATNRLGWLNDAMVNQVGEWRGAKELRGIYCSRFQPADGVETEASHAQFSASAGEARMSQIEPPKPMRLLSGVAEPVSADPECQEIVERLDKTTDLGGIRVRKSDTLAARRWMESIGLGHMTGLPPLKEGE